MVVFNLQLQTPPQKRDEIVETLKSMLGPTRAERGCTGCHLQLDMDDPNLITFNEEWERQTDLNRHVASEEYRKLLAVIDMAGAPPSVRLLEVLDQSGLSRIAEARQAKYRADEQ